MISYSLMEAPIQPATGSRVNAHAAQRDMEISECNSRLDLALHLLFSGSLVRTPQYSWCTLLCTRYAQKRAPGCFCEIQHAKNQEGDHDGRRSQYFLTDGGRSPYVRKLVRLKAMPGSWCHSKLNQKSSRLAGGL